MVKYLIWTDRALAEYEQLLDYLSEEWGTVVTKRVGFEIEEKVSLFRIILNNIPYLLRSRILDDALPLHKLQSILRYSTIKLK